MFHKIKFNAKRTGTFFVLSAWVLSILACSQSYLSSVDLTATAQSGGAILPTLAIETPVFETQSPNSPTPDPPEIIQTFTPADTFTPSPTVPTPTPSISNTPKPPLLYYTQAGDTLPVIAARFGVSPDEIDAPESIPSESLISPEQLLIIPDRLDEVGPEKTIIPDSEVVYAPSGLDFNIEQFVNDAGGYLSTYREYLAYGWLTGAQVIQKVATDESINPRLLLALLEYQSHWVYGQPTNIVETDYPMGYVNLDKKGLYKQMAWAVQQLSLGYYGWREGLVTEISFMDGSSVRIAPTLNAGSVAVQSYLSNFYDSARWLGVLDGAENFPDLYENMFGNPWVRAQTVEPLFPASIVQPTLELPFFANRMWSFTGGPHAAWGSNGARAALDFAPASTEHGCVTSDEWVTAMAPGLVLRSENGLVVIDLDGDGSEQTGWVLLYLHIATKGRIAVGTYVDQDGLIGHPSCEGGSATGTHVHIARKYNGEWIPADGPLPFVLSGWQTHAGEEIYTGTLTKGDLVVTSSVYGSFESRIVRDALGQ